MSGILPGAPKARPCRDRTPNEVMFRLSEVSTETIGLVRSLAESGLHDVGDHIGAMVERSAIVALLTGVSVDVLMRAEVARLADSVTEYTAIHHESLAADLLKRIADLQELHGFFGAYDDSCSFTDSRPELLRFFYDPEEFFANIEAARKASRRTARGRRGAAATAAPTATGRPGRTGARDTATQ